MGTPLAELCELIVDSEHKTAPVVDNGYPMIRTPNIGEGRFLLDGVRLVDAETYAAWTRRAVPREGDLILAREAPVGNVAMIIPGMQPILGQRTVLIRPNRGKVEPAYLQYLMLSRELQHRMWSLSNGATVPHLNMKDIRELDVPDLPPLAVQGKIAAVLAAYDELIENNLRRIEILEEMAQAVHQEWFVNFRFPGHEKVALVDSPLGPIPEVWEVGLLSDFTSTQYGYTASTDTDPVGPRFLRGMDFNKRAWIDWSEVPFCPIDGAAFPKYRLDKGDVLVIRMADPGKVAIVEKDVEAVFASYVVRVTPDPGMALPYWIFYLMSSPDYQGYVSGASTGTTRKSASAGVLTGMRLALPPLPVQEAFVDVVEPVRSLLNNLVDQNANLRTTRDLLLPKLVSGEIDVAELDIEAEWLAS